MGKHKGRRAPRRPDKARKAERDDGDQKEQAVVMDAVVSQALPNAMFEVEVEGGHKLIAYAAGSSTATGINPHEIRGFAVISRGPLT